MTWHFQIFYVFCTQARFKFAVAPTVESLWCYLPKNSFSIIVSTYLTIEKVNSIFDQPSMLVYETTFEQIIIFIFRSVRGLPLNEGTTLNAKTSNYVVFHLLSTFYILFLPRRNNDSKNNVTIFYSFLKGFQLRT